MKRNFKYRPLLLLASVVLGASSCTKNFESYNTNPSSLSASQTAVILPLAYGTMEQAIYADYQTAQNLSADGYCGFMSTNTPFSGNINDQTYAMVDGWNRNGFNDQYAQIMSNVADIRNFGIPATHPDMWAVALLIQVEAMDRVTDRFGPIPYSKAGTSFTSVPYDSQQDVYNLFFSQIDTAVANLKAYIATNPGNTTNLGAGDLVYKGHYEQWLKFANSLRLRLAMRIVKADAVTAQAQAEKALTDPGGLLATPADDAMFSQSGNRHNDFWLIAESYGNTRMGAALVTYMNGYNDPRLPVYALPATDPTVVGSIGSGKYIGIRLGATVNTQIYGGYSNLNVNSTFTETASQPLMTAAEVWFLKAEAALRGWANAGSIQTDYTTGINTSFQQWGVNGGNYTSDVTSTETNYADPNNSANNAAALSAITIQWDPTATNEQMLERIITQKWLAIFPDGQEAWADYRRTGYPRLFPVVNNYSNGAISTSVQIRRLPYPQSEYQTNSSAVSNAVSNLLNGADNGGTRLWWDVNKGNF